MTSLRLEAGTLGMILNMGALVMYLLGSYCLRIEMPCVMGVTLE